jgi:hypothetical protein
MRCKPAGPGFESKLNLAPVVLIRHLSRFCTVLLLNDWDKTCTVSPGFETNLYLALVVLICLKVVSREKMFG